jgi:hypothetical protein
METRSTSSFTQGSQDDKPALILTACLLGALMVFLIYGHNFVFGSGPGNWSYDYLRTAVATPLWIPAVVLILLGLSVFIGSMLIHVRERATLLVCGVAAILVQVLIRDVSAVPLGSIVKDAEANGFYSVAMRYSPVEILSGFEALVPSFPQHAQTNMPGKILFFQLLRLLTPSPEIMGYLVLVLSACGAFLLYWICRRLFHDKLAAFYAFILYALIPCRLFFLPVLNTLTPLFLLLCLYLFLSYMEARKVLSLWLLGAVLYLLVLFEPSPLVGGIVFAGIFVGTIRKGTPTRARDILILLGIPAVSFLCVYILFRTLFSFDLLRVLGFVLNDAVQFNATVERGYWLWIGENTKEFFYSAGTPIVIITVYWAMQMLTNPRRPADAVLSWSMETILVLSLLITYAVVLLLGINRGEISRLWIYLAVLFQIPAAVFIARTPKSPVFFFLVACTLVAQSMVALQRIGFV